MAKINFEELGKKERILLLRAFDCDVDEEDYVLDQAGNRIPSKEIPSKYLSVNDTALIPGSLGIIDGTPSSISKFIRETEERQDGNTND